MKISDKHSILASIHLPGDGSYGVQARLLGLLHSEFNIYGIHEETTLLKAEAVPLIVQDKFDILADDIKLL